MGARRFGRGARCLCCSGLVERHSPLSHGAEQRPLHVLARRHGGAACCVGDNDDSPFDQPLGRRARRPQEMSSHVLRAVLAGLLIATVAAKIWGPRNIAEVDTRAAVVALVTSQGWSA